MSYLQKFSDLIEAGKFAEAARFVAEMPEHLMTMVGREDPETNYRTVVMTDVIEAAFGAGAWDQLRAIKDDPECAPHLSDEMRYRIQDETPTLIMRDLAPTDFDDDAPTNPRGAVLG